MKFSKKRHVSGWFGLSRCPTCYRDLASGSRICGECSVSQEMDVEEEGDDRNVRSRLGDVRCFNQEDEVVDENWGVELVREVNTGGWDETGGGEKDMTLEEARAVDEAIRRQRILVETAYWEGEGDEEGDEEGEGDGDRDGDGDGDGDEDEEEVQEQEQEEQDAVEEDDNSEGDNGRVGGGGASIMGDNGEEDGAGGGCEQLIGVEVVMGGVEGILECRNCRRRRPDPIDYRGRYRLRLRRYQRSDLANMFSRKKFACFRQGDISNVGIVVLCDECASFLVHCRERGMVDKWPAFIWKLLSNDKLVASRGINLWCYVPDAWRIWWLDVIRERAPFRGVTMATPPFIFKDVSSGRDALCGSLQRLVLRELMENCDKHLHATVRCPWGCTEYLHKAMSMPLDVVFQRYLGADLLIDAKRGCHIVMGSARNDYDDPTDVSLILMNAEWRIMPSVAFFDNGEPRVLVCRNHKGGTKLDYVHMARHPRGILPDAMSDQLAHAVVVPRTIRPMKAHAYSTSYQMHEMRGSYGGLDTLSVTNIGRYDVPSTIRDMNERVAIAGRKDIRGLVTGRASEGIIPAWFGAALLNDADVEEENLKSAFEDELAGASGAHVEQKEWWEHFCAGATRVTFHDSVKLQRLMNDATGGCVIRLSGVAPGQPDTVLIVGCWPRDIVWAHGTNKYGACFPSLPPVRKSGYDTRFLWILLGMMVSVPTFWTAVASSVRADDEWPGWMLTYATRKCMLSRKGKSSGSDPFKKAKGIAGLMQVVAAAFVSEMFTTELFRSVLNIVERIYLVDTSVVGDNEVTVLDCVDTLVVVRSESHGRVDVPNVIRAICGRTFELRFVSVSESGDPDRNINGWSGTCYCRHGGVNFPGWWRQGRNDSVPSQCCDGLPDDIAILWNVAVFVNTEQSLEKSRDEYLKYIGGQNDVYCETHKVPLIASDPRLSSELICSFKCENGGGNAEGRCSKRIFLACPVRTCRGCICKKHKDVHCNGGDKLYVRARVTENGRADDGGRNGIENDGEIGNGDNDDGDDDEQTHYLQELGWDESDELFAEGVSVNEEVEINEALTDAEVRAVVRDGMFVTDAQMFDDDMVDDTEGRSFDFFSSNAGVAAVPIWDARDPERVARSFITNHVILNNCGSCLVRRKGQLKPRRHEAAFLERIVSVGANESVPLVYPEAMLYPSLFWKDDAEGSMYGALPSALLAGDRECGRLGFAGVGEHMRCRLTDLSGRGSTDPRYIFHAFDCMANVNLRGQDSRIVLSRGFMKEEATYALCGNKSLHFNTDAIDSRPVVNRLAAALQEELATYFFTQTCNQRDFFGVRPIKRWIDGEAFRDEVRHQYGLCPTDNDEEFIRAMQQSACVPINRNWMEVAEIYMAYIARSSERPLGSVKKIWWRHEYQDSSGNLSHLHCLIWIDDCTEIDTLDRIRGTIGDIIRPEEIPIFVAEGLLESPEDANVVRELARKVLVHSHSSRCLRRTGPGPNDFTCRVPNGMVESPDPTKHCFKELKMVHVPGVLDVMEDLGFCTLNEQGEVVTIDEAFVSTRHFPPCDAETGIVSPTSSRLFVATRSQCNLQLCTRYFSSRYLAKYAAGIDESNIVYVSAATPVDARNEPSTVDANNVINNERDGRHTLAPMDQPTAGLVMENVFLHNTKITSSAANEKKAHQTRRNRAHPKGRAISITEATSLMLGYPQVYTNLEFIEIPTVALEDRAGVERVTPIVFAGLEDARTITGPQDLHDGEGIACYAIREELSEQWRRLMDSEINMLRDQLFSPVSVDRTTIFGVRPPELRFVKKQGLYFRWFCRDKPVRSYDKAVKLHEKMVLEDLYETGWVDGLNSRVRLRRQALTEITAYMQENINHFSVDRRLIQMISSMNSWSVSAPLLTREKIQWQRWQELLLCPFDIGGPHQNLPIVVYSNIKPTQMHRFVLHMLLSMGEFDNELQLFSVGDMKAAYAAAGLINTDDMEGSVKALLRSYVLTQLMYMPGGTRMFDRMLVAAHELLRSLLLDGDMLIDEMPSVLYTQLQRDGETRVMERAKHLRAKLAEVTVARVRLHSAQCNIPDACYFANATQQSPLMNAVHIEKSVRQSDQSYVEQQAAFKAGMKSIVQYRSVSRTQAKSVCIVGPPGTGKTFVMSLLVLEAMSMGLSCTVSALMAERSLLLGGVHIHKLFEIPVHEAATPHRLAELALLRIFKTPEALYILQTLDILFLDEQGQFAAQLLSILDIILRRVRNSCQYMGGVLVISTQDPVQLKPVRGLPALLSPFMISCYRFARLVHSVRASRDLPFQRLQDISRMLNTAYRDDPNLITEFRTLLKDNCVFFDDWNDPRITIGMLQVFGRHAAVREAERRLLHRIFSGGQRSVVTSTARDYEMSSSSHSGWTDASDATTRFLNRNVKESQKLHFFHGGVYEMTFNLKNRFSQSQLAVLEMMPTTEDVRYFRDVKILIAPEGCKTLPNGVFDVNVLRQYGWTSSTIGMAPEIVHTVTGRAIKAKRQQYGMKHRIAATIHATMGCEFDKLVTAVSKQNKSYALWEKEQVVVLLSRTKCAKDLIFVGNQEDTLDALCELIQLKSQFSEYMAHVLNRLCDSNEHERRCPTTFPAIDYGYHPYRPIDIEKPQDSSGFCYILVSLKNFASTYIGQSWNLVKRLKEHNTGHGSQQTAASSLRPWALLAFVCGFERDKAFMLSFERHWKQRRDSTLAQNGSQTPSQIADLAKDVILHFGRHERGSELRFVQCATLHYRGDASDATSLVP